LDWENQPDSQMQGWHEFEYAIYPHRGRWTDSDVFAQAHGFNLPMRMVQCGQHQGALPKALSFLTIEPKTLVPSGIKLSESGNAIIVRVFNPTSEKVKGTIKFFRSLRSVRLVRLDEQPVEELKVKNGSCVEIEAGPKRIITVEITPA
ncbi:alpha-mannosidase, partial [candidate division KSB1 bacterium]